MLWFKQSTAATVIVGPVLDSTGAEYASAVIGDLSLSKNGGTLTALASAASLTYIANGYYTLVLTTGNTDTLGRAEISCNKSTYQMPPRELMVLPATVYDALVTNATTAAGGLGDIQRMAGTALTARDIGASVLLSSGTGTGQVTLTSGRVNADLTHIAAAAVNTASAQLGVNVVNFGGSAGTFASGRPAVNASYIGGVPVTATVSITFPSTCTVATTTGAVGSVTGAVGSVTGDVGGNVTGSVGSVVGAVGSVTGNVGGNVTGSVGSVATGGITAASFASDAITAAKVASDVSAEIADAVWDEMLSGHVGAGSAGAALSAAGSAGDPWGTALPGAYSAGTAGYILGTNLDAAVSTRSTYAGADTSGTTTLLGRLTSTRAGYIDNLSAGAVALASGVTVTTNNDKAGYSLSQSFPTNFATLSIDGSGKVLLQATQTGVTIPTVTTVTNNPGLDAAGVRAAVGLASANLDTQLGDLPTASETATAVLAAGDVDGYTLEQTLKLCLAALAGKISGAATTTVTIRSADDTANRLVATCDSDGNRTAVTLNAAG